MARGGIWHHLAALVAALGVPTATQSFPIPLNKLDPTVEAIVVDALGTIPLGKVPVTVFKVADFAREVGDNALDKEDEARGDDMVLMRADAALIKGLVAQGQGNGPQAAAAKARLAQLRDRWDSGDVGSVNHLLNVTANHFGYAVGRASLRKALSMGFKKFRKQDPIARFLRKYVHFGEVSDTVIGRYGMLGDVLAKSGWRKFGTRSAFVERYIDRATDVFLDKKIDLEFGKQISKAAADAFDSFSSRVTQGDPSPLAMRRRIRSQLLAQPAVAPLLLAPFATPYPVLAPASAAPAPARAMPVSADRRFAPDLLAQTITTEDRYIDRYVPDPAPSEPSTYRSEPAPPPEPEQPSARDIERHQELMCVGAGNKAGCERWNSSSNESTWDGRRGERAVTNQ